MLEWVREPVAPRFVPQVHDADPDGDLDDAHGAVWDAVRHLFPRDALVTRTDYGWLVVSWKIPAGRGGTHYAAPVVIRIPQGLLLALWASDDAGRREIAALQVDTVREALEGYDPRSRVTTCDAIVLGED